MAEIAKQETFLFMRCADIPSSPYFSSLITWFRNELPQFSWNHFTKLMPNAWMGIILVDNRLAARLRINLGVPTEVTLNTSQSFNREKVIYIDKVYVDPHFQKKEFAEKIIRQALSKIRGFGASPLAQVWAETDRDNKAMIAVYKQLTFIEMPIAKGGEKLRWFSLMRELGSA